MNAMKHKVSTLRNICSSSVGLTESNGANYRKYMRLPAHHARIGEGGLRTVGKFKQSLPGQPLVSILTAVFNGVQFLEQTIVSVLNQDYTNVEFIVIDGGSTDGTIDILHKYSEVIDYWVSEPDTGISDAFNKAVQLSTGEYLNFQGAGDFLVEKNVVSRIIDGVDPKINMLICGRVQRVEEHDPSIVIWTMPRKFKPSFDKRSLLFRMSLPHQGLLTNRRMFERYGLFDTNNAFCMDYEHLLRSYHEFPKVVMKEVIYSSWRAGGVGTDRIYEILNEYTQIKLNNKVAPFWTIHLIDIYTKFKYIIKKYIKKFA